MGNSHSCCPTVAYLVIPAMRERCPDDANVLIGRRCRRHILFAPTHEPPQPTVRVPRLTLAQSEHGPGAVSPQRAQIRVAPLVHSQQYSCSAAMAVQVPQLMPQQLRRLVEHAMQIALAVFGNISQPSNKVADALQMDSPIFGQRASDEAGLCSALSRIPAARGAAPAPLGAQRSSPVRSRQPCAQSRLISRRPTPSVDVPRTSRTLSTDDSVCWVLRYGRTIRGRAMREALRGVGMDLRHALRSIRSTRFWPNGVVPRRRQLLSPQATAIE